MKNTTEKGDAGQSADAVKTCSKCKVTKSVSEFPFTGVKRANGTMALISQCKECKSVYQREYKEKNREQVLVKGRESRRKWCKENPDKDKECSSRWRKRHPFGAKLVSIRHYAKKLGYANCTATEAEVEAAYTGKCDVCGVPAEECTTSLHLDHDHFSGAFRGFLCGRCNRTLGMVGDSKETLIDLLHYLMNPVQK